MHEGSKEDDNSDDEDYNYLRSRRPQKSAIGDFAYLGGDRVRSKDFKITFLSVGLIVLPSLLYLIAM